MSGALNEKHGYFDILITKYLIGKKLLKILFKINTFLFRKFFYYKLNVTITLTKNVLSLIL